MTLSIPTLKYRVLSKIYDGLYIYYQILLVALHLQVLVVDDNNEYNDDNYGD